MKTWKAWGTIGVKVKARSEKEAMNKAEMALFQLDPVKFEYEIEEADEIEDLNPAAGWEP